MYLELLSDFKLRGGCRSQALRQMRRFSVSGLGRAGVLREHGVAVGELILLHVSDLDEVVEVLEEDLDNLRVKVVPALLPDELQDPVQRPGLLVAPVRSERVEHVVAGRAEFRSAGEDESRPLPESSLGGCHGHPAGRRGG